MVDYPRYRLIAPAYLQPRQHAGASRFQAGAEFEFEGVPAFAMMPLNATASAAKAAAIRARSLRFLRQPPAGDRTMLITLVKSIGGTAGAVAEMATQVETWLSAHPPPQEDLNP
jgi:hypothetical protein